MNDAIKIMLARYKAQSTQDHENALHEVIQEIALLGLWRGKFFEHAAFYGGTALRILYGLDRFSEDLDFSLLKPNKSFSLDKYFPFVKNELTSFGFTVEVEAKKKSKESAIASAFIKAGTAEHLLKIGVRDKVAKEQKITIKFEVDTDPPPHFKTDAKFLLNPVPFSVQTFVPADLFAGKMHAVLFRGWKNRVKGRDWYDLVWYAQRDTPLHLKHLEARMVQSGNWEGSEKLTSEKFLAVVKKRIAGLDVGKAKNDVRPFLRDANSLDVWSKDFFLEVAKKIRVE